MVLGDFGDFGCFPGILGDFRVFQGFGIYLGFETFVEVCYFGWVFVDVGFGFGL